MDTAFLFSGGKDSLAVLHMLRSRWDDIYVIWANPGAPYESTLEQMRSLECELPHFIEVRGDQPAQIERYGYPVDVLPINQTRQVKDLHGVNGVLLQSYLDCCGANLWGPTTTKLVALGVKRCILAFRRDESIDNLIRGNRLDGGIEYVFPIIDWSAERVFAYLAEHGIELPPEYGLGEKKSRDCWNCTAWLHEDVERIRNLPPPEKAEMRRRITAIKRATDDSLRHLNNALESASA